MSEPVLTLFSDSLLSKFGFNDGDAPDDFLDWLEAGGHGWRIHWRPVLAKLVEDYLVPALAQKVQTIRVSTNHNPVRAWTVDGADVEDCWTGRSRAEPELTPEYVEVPFSVVLGVALELGALGAH